MKDIGKEKLAVGLQRRYEESVRRDKIDFQYLILAHDYTAYILQHPVLDHLVGKVILAEASNLLRTQKMLNQTLGIEVAQVYATLKKYVADAAIDDEVINERLNRYEMYRKEQIVSSAGQIPEMHESVDRVLERLKELGHDKFLKRFIVEVQNTPKGPIKTEYQVAASMKPYRDASRNYERSKKISPWGAFEDLLMLYRAFECYKGNYKVFPKTEHIELNTVLLLASAVEHFERQPEKDHGFWGDPKQNIERLHFALLDALDEFENTDQINIPTEKKIEQHGPEPKAKGKPELVTGLDGKKACGYFKFNKRGKRIMIGGVSTRPYRLLRALMTPQFGVTRTLDSVFDAVKRDKDAQDQMLKGHHAPYRQKEILENAWREVLKKRDMQGKIRLAFAESDSQVYLILK